MYNSNVYNHIEYSPVVLLVPDEVDEGCSCWAIFEISARVAMRTGAMPSDPA